MTLNIVDIIIILFILLCMITGFKRGFIRETINLIGNIIVIILSYKFMAPLASVLYKYVPFFDLGFFGMPLTSLNILIFQILAFLLCYLLFTLILNIIVNITNVVDNIVNSLIMFKALSSILGMIVGLIAGFIATFIILIILSVPLYKSNYFHKSPVANFILDKTPVMSNATKNIREATEDIYKISVEINSDKNYKENAKKYDREVLDSMLKYKVITYDNAKMLNDEHKLDNIENVDELLKTYEKTSEE